MNAQRAPGSSMRFWGGGKGGWGGTKNRAGWGLGRLRFCIYCGWRWERRVSEVHHLLVILKCKIGNLALVKRNTSNLNDQLPKSNIISKTKDPQRRVRGYLVLFLVMWLAMCLFEITIVGVENYTISLQK